MKIRAGFVSNSSSASFTIPLSKITEEQLLKIVDHGEIAVELEMEYPEDAWEIQVHRCRGGWGWVEGFTWMDNFDMHHFFEVIGISEDVVKWHEDGG